MFSAEQNRNIVLWQCFILYSSCSYLSCIGYRLSVIGYRLSVIGYRLSVIGYISRWGKFKHRLVRCK
ncbi:hypothetical protein DXE03_24920 [Vibrio parahaemolyticus]|nr:hypothetical protein DXE03_24920 [Vibrio parahaemolyticus]